MHDPKLAADTYVALSIFKIFIGWDWECCFENEELVLRQNKFYKESSCFDMIPFGGRKDYVYEEEAHISSILYQR